MEIHSYAFGIHAYLAIKHELRKVRVGLKIKFLPAFFLFFFPFSDSLRLFEELRPSIVTIRIGGVVGIECTPVVT